MWGKLTHRSFRESFVVGLNHFSHNKTPRPSTSSCGHFCEMFATFGWTARIQITGLPRVALFDVCSSQGKVILLLWRLWRRALSLQVLHIVTQNSTIEYLSEWKLTWSKGTLWCAILVRCTSVQVVITVTYIKALIQPNSLACVAVRRKNKC
jgi:hypothetical protein